MQNASKYIRCKQTAFKRAVLLQLSQPSTSSLYVAICHNMSQHVMICHDVSRCHQRSTGLFSDEWAVLQKEVNGVEDVPCKRTDDARGSWVLQEILVSGDKLDIILFPSKKISRDFCIQKISRDITAKYEGKQELKLKSSTFHTDILTILYF